MQMQGADWLPGGESEQSVKHVCVAEREREEAKEGFFSCRLAFCPREAGLLSAESHSLLLPPPKKSAQAPESGS